VKTQLPLIENKRQFSKRKVFIICIVSIVSFRHFISKALPVFLILFSFSLYAKRFKAPYVKFDIKYDWTCKSFGVDWVCHHRLHREARPAFMLITAKEGSHSDHTGMYIQVFNRKLTPYSKVHTRKILVNRHTWLESFYRDSLLGDLFNRYVATICCDKAKVKIHVLIGFHAQRGSYIEYAREFLRAIKSLRLSGNLEETLEQIRRQSAQQRKDMMAYIKRILLETDTELKSREEYKFLFSLLFFCIIFICFAALVYFLYRKKGKNRKMRRKIRRSKKSLK